MLRPGPGNRVTRIINRPWRIHYLREEWLLIFLLVALILITNTFINAIVLKVLGVNTRDSLYAGALLAQIGEFRFVLAAVGIQSSIITEYGYQLVIQVISISLLLSPFWIKLVKVSIAKFYDKKTI